MRKLLIIMLLLAFFAVPVHAMDFTAPEAPDSVDDLMPVETESFSEGLWKIITNGFAKFQPKIAESVGVCLSLVALAILLSIVQQFSENMAGSVQIVGVLAVAALLLDRTNSMIRLGAETVTQISEYGKLLLPVMTAAMAAQGGTTTSVALYTGTAVFDSVLSGLISNLMVPMIYIYLVLAVTGAAAGEDTVGKLRDFVKWLISWSLKTVLYIFTGYISITGAVSGSADAAAIKAAKLTISGMVPVVGGILSDASEAVIVGAGIMKGSVGVYGMLAIAAISIGPFLELGAHYLILKLTGIICEAFGVKTVCSLIKCFSSAMGLLMGMTASVCFLLMISTVCFMRGLG